MSLKAIIPMGQTEITVNGLHQWDYGRKLEIHADDLPALIEVHFSCTGMDSAIVRSCAVVNGVAEAAIPDRCLEQTAPVTAWVYFVEETAGRTAKTITMPIIARTRPQATATDPEAYSDKYTEAVTAMNELVQEVEGALADTAAEVLADVSEKIESGELPVAEASHATSADSATHATDADSSTNATKAHSVVCVDRIDSIAISANSDSASIQTTVQLPAGYFPLCITGCAVVLTTGSNASYEISDSGTDGVGRPRVVINAVGVNQGTTLEGGTVYNIAGSVSLTGLFLRYSTNQ